jgi:hypothetical protein
MTKKDDLTKLQGVLFVFLCALCGFVRKGCSSFLTLSPEELQGPEGVAFKPLFDFLKRLQPFDKLRAGPSLSHLKE